MDAEPSSHIFSPRQRAVYEALVDKNEHLAIMYRGALVVLEQPDNPDRLALAAHGLRELMEKIPSILDVQTKAHNESLNGKVRELEDQWKTTLRSTSCWSEETWTGEIDRPLKSFLGKMEAFFGWLSEFRPRRRVEATRVLRKLDGSGRFLPEPLENLTVNYWQEIRDFFIGVAHHGNYDATFDDFIIWMEELEKFLLDRLRPRTFGDLDVIDQLILEGERDA